MSTIGEGLGWSWRKRVDVPSNAPFAPAYAPMLSRASKLAPLLMLTMTPNRRLRMYGNTLWISRKGSKDIVSI